MRRWGPAVVALLLLAATAVAFATTERQKLERTPFAVVRVDDVFSPVCRCSTNGAAIALRFRRTHVYGFEPARKHKTKAKKHKPKRPKRP